ncbi:hypothetical protein GCM10022268_17340 [Sphingomonas cynarae]|uniref:Uncharacterized protein n=1 Tax=Sphingomonas cynarae TaxID=930197 RepID=A0ABP7DPQ1_9SPHN
MGKLQRRLDDGLTLWVRQLAWYHATPKPDPNSKRGKVEPAAPRLSRIETAKQRKTEPRMPPNPAPHFTDWLIELGISEAAGMGAAPLSWREIEAWSSGTGVRPEPWEKRLLRRLSAIYLAEGRLAESEHCPPPWRMGVTAREREVEEAQLRSVLG